MSATIVIDSFFRAQIPPLSVQERTALEENILEHGCRDPLTVWMQGDGTAVLIDGHNRHEICTRNGVPFSTVEVDFADRDAAEDWIDANQIGRRNLTEDAFRLLLGRRYNRQKGQHGGDRRPASLSERAKAHGETLPAAAKPGGNTAAALAQQHGVAAATVKRAAKFADEVAANEALQDAILQGIPVKKVKQQLKRSAAVARGDKIAEANAPLEPTGRRYQVILADPPWEYKTWGEGGTDRSASNHYPVMPTEDIAALNVAAMAADDCALFMWACWPNLHDAFEVIDAWGFKYVGIGFNWIKTNADGSPFFGQGHWTRKNSEPCLMATRGTPVRLDAGVSEVLMAPRREHSRKPLVHTQIQRLVPGPYLEMFCRDPADGWDAWGNQAAGIFE